MVRLTSITTKTGDDGMTGLGSGERRSKHDRRIEAYGAVDEANSAIGLARALIEDQALAAILAYVQNNLFDLGADLCVPLQKGEKGDEGKTLRIGAGHTKRLEDDSLRLNESLPALDSFILPAGLPPVAALHLARTITRRAERRITALKEHEAINEEVLRYINRLSDLLFIMARYADRNKNAENIKEEKWTPKK